MTTIIDETGIPIHQLYRIIEKGMELKLITTGIDNPSHQNRNMVKFIEKGRKMGEKILEMLEILNSY